MCKSILGQYNYPLLSVIIRYYPLLSVIMDQDKKLWSKNEIKITIFES